MTHPCLDHKKQDAYEALLITAHTEALHWNTFQSSITYFLSRDMEGARLNKLSERFTTIYRRRHVKAFDRWMNENPTI